MMERTDIKTIKKSRKFARCHWCWESIPVGSSYKTWFTYGENTTTKMHPECLEAMFQVDLYDDCLPTAGTYNRGCHCGEIKEICECNR